jgi:hypothetical protein
MRDKIFEKKRREGTQIKIIETRCGDTISGWWITPSPKGIVTNPDPQNLSSRGWCQVFCCFMFCFPCTLSPCFLSCNYDAYQTPVYQDHHQVCEEQ